MKKILNIVQLVSFILMAITSIPLTISFFMDKEPKIEAISHIHVIFGILFLIFAIPSMILRKKEMQNAK